MHFLCLHGLGTNSQVLETQTATVRYEMDQHHTFDFVEGTKAFEISPQIKAFFPANDTYYAYHEEDSSEGILQALSQLHNYIEEEGPFDGVIGFSQGAGLAATYLIQQNRERPRDPSPFRCAIFFSGAQPYDVPSLTQGKIEPVEWRKDGSELQAPLNIPTSHIWGRNDAYYKHMSEKLWSLCNDAERDGYVHEGGHEIPGARAKDDVQRCVRSIRRTIDKASVDH